MDITGDPQGPPTKVGTSIADMVSSLYAAQAVLAALFRRERTGRGARLDVAMLDAMASLLTFNAGIYFATGKTPTRRGNIHATITPYEPFETSDGWINVAVGNDRFWKLFCPAIGRPDLTDEPRFARAPDRVTNRAALTAILKPILKSKTRRHWRAAFEAAGVPCGEIKTVGEVCETPQLAERGVLRSVPHPAAGPMRYIASPVRYDDQPPQEASPPPLLGEHTACVLNAWLGLTPADIEDYSRRGAFGAAAHQEMK